MLIEFGLLINALLLGVMISFIIVTSPTVFKTLDGENSKKIEVQLEIESGEKRITMETDESYSLDIMDSGK